MRIITLASGSKGNATYIETKNTKILIDAGISYLQLRNRLQQRGVILTKLDAIVLTHEHTDHIKHLSSIAFKTNARILMSEVTYPNAFSRLSGSLANLDVAFIKENLKYKKYVYKINELFMMTPYYYTTHNNFDINLKECEVSFDFLIRLYKKRK